MWIILGRMLLSPKSYQSSRQNEDFAGEPTKVHADATKMHVHSTKVHVDFYQSTRA